MATEVSLPDLGVDIGASQPDIGQESTQEPTESHPSPQAQQRESDRAYQQWLKTLREDGDQGKFARRAKDDFARLQELRRLDPKGIEGVRELKGLVDGLAHGEKKGVEALSAIQESLAESQAVLDAISEGGPEAFQSLNEEQQMGMLRMVPSFLDHLATNNQDAYTAALLPHFVGALRESELATSFNSLVNVLNEKPPTWLTPDQKGQWTEDRIARITQQASTMSQWFKAQEDRLKQLDQTEKQPSQGQTAQPAAETKQYWEQSIHPQTNAHAEQKFTETLKPWEERLAKNGIRLSEAKKQAMAREFMAEVQEAALKNPAYVRQIRHYNAQRKPDAGAVASTFKAEFNRHANKAMENLVRRDYGQILEKGAAVKKPDAAAPRAASTPEKGVKIVTMKPSKDRINYQRTPLDWLHSDKFVLKDGSVVQYRP